MNNESDKKTNINVCVTLTNTSLTTTTVKTSVNTTTTSSLKNSSSQKKHNQNQQFSISSSTNYKKSKKKLASGLIRTPPSACNNNQNYNINLNLNEFDCNSLSINSLNAGGSDFNNTKCRDRNTSGKTNLSANGKNMSNSTTNTMAAASAPSASIGSSTTTSSEGNTERKSNSAAPLSRNMNISKNNLKKTSCGRSSEKQKNYENTSCIAQKPDSVISSKYAGTIPGVQQTTLESPSTSALAATSLANAAAAALAAVGPTARNSSKVNLTSKGSSSTSSSSSSSSLSSSSSVGIVQAISTALQNISYKRTGDTSDTDTEVFPNRIPDMSESDEESVSEILLACLCLRPDLLDDIPESDPESCGNDVDGNEDEDDGDDEDEDEEDEIQDPSEVTGNFLLDTATDQSRKLTALFEAAANEKAPVLRHATLAIDETKQALTKMRCANSPRDKTIFSRTLIAACTDNDVNTVRRLLGKGNININESTDDGESLLSMACSAGYYELAQVLLAMSAAQVEDKGQKDCTPLMEAASAGHIDIVKLLLSHNADVNAQCTTGNTPLMFACAGGHVEVVKELLKHGGNVEDQNENGHTPLMEAASAGHVEVAKVLLEHGAGINTHSNEFKESALTLACYKGHLNMVRFLLQAGADQEHKTDEMHTALMEASMDGHVEVARLLLDSGAQVNMPTDSFESPLTLAACGGHVELATLLIERGANIEEVNDEGYTPLMEAAREGHEDMVSLLLTKGANINATTEETQETALTLACCGGFTEVAEFLIKQGADLELGASTPLMEAAQEGHTDLVKFLLENGANVHAQTQTGDTALTHACENGHTDAAEVLLYFGAELEHESEGGRTPLMKACRAGHLCTVKFLIGKGAEVNKQTTSNDHTPLSLACAGGHQAVVEYLLKSGADPFHKLKDNSTMLIEAAKGGHIRVVELLFKYPNFNQTHQSELQSNLINSNNGQMQLHGMNLQQQKHIQQQLNQLAAPPGLHEVPEAVRVTNQQILSQHQQFTTPTNDYNLEENMIANTADGFVIDPNVRNAQHQEALIAKMRLFQMQAGLEKGIAQGMVLGLLAAKNKKFGSSSASGNNPGIEENLPALSSGSNNAISSVSANCTKQKSLLRKNRQPPAPFELNLTSSEVQQVRSQPLGEDFNSTSASVLTAAIANLSVKDEQSNLFDELQKKTNIQLVCENGGPPATLMPSSYVDMNESPEQGLICSADGLNFLASTGTGPIVGPVPGASLMQSATLATFISGANDTDNIPFIMGPPSGSLESSIGNVQNYQFFSSSAQPTVSGDEAMIPTLSNTVATTTASTLITTLSEVSQSTAISDRPKAKPVSKKDVKNLRKPTAVLQKNQMVSIFNNLVSQGVYSETAKKFQQLGKIIGGMSGSAPSSDKSLQQALRTLSSATSQATKCLEEASELSMDDLAEDSMKVDFSKNPQIIERTISQFTCEMLKQHYENTGEMPTADTLDEIQCMFLDQPKSPTESPPLLSPNAVMSNKVETGDITEVNLIGILSNSPDAIMQASSNNIANESPASSVKAIDDYEDDDDDDEEDDGDDDDDDDDDEEDEEDDENEEENDDEDDDEDDEEDIELNCSSNQGIRKISHCLEDMKSDEIARVLCEFKPNLNVSELVQGFPQLPNFMPQSKVTAINNLQQFTLHQDKSAGSFAHHEDHFRFYHQIDNVDDDTITECGIYPTLGEPLDQFSTVDDQSRDQICGYELGLDCMEEFLNVMQNAEPPMTEITTNLNCPEFAEFGLGQICKTRWAGQWIPPSQSTSADILAQQLQQQQCIANNGDNQSRNAENQLLMDHQLQHRLSESELNLLSRIQNQQQQHIALPLMPLTADDQLALHDAGLRTLSNSQLQLQPQNSPTSNSDVLTSSLLQATHQTLMQQNQQLQNGQVMGGDNQQAAKIVFNVDSEKPSQSLQLLFQLPPVQQGQSQTPAAIITAQQPQHSACTSAHAIAQTQTAASCQSKMYTPTNLSVQSNHATQLTQQVFSQQVLNQLPSQSCAQHTQQVQVATQTQLQPILPSGQFCNNSPNVLDGNTTDIVPMQQHNAPANKPVGGVVKKTIDAPRKDRKHYTVVRQTPAGSQANTTTQQYSIQQQQQTNAVIDKTIDVDSETDSNHDTALTLACAGGHEELVELLISRDANIEHRDKKGFTPLILAATAGHEKVVDILLKHRAELEAQSERTKDTPLSLACSGGRYEVVELLLSVGANKEHRNVSDYTPLSLAASGGYVNIIKLLLSHGAEINSRTGSKLGISPLMLAAMNGHTAAVKLLLDQGSDINAQIETNRNTALTLACFQGRHEVVSLLLDRKANVEHRAKTGLTPLMEAASGGYIEVGRVLLDKGADVNAAPVPTSRDTALTIAADKGHLKFVELLLSRGASVEVKNKKGNSPLWLAAHGGHLNVVEVLYANNADIDSQDNRRVSCLMAAFRKGHTKVVRWMVQHVTQFPSDQELTRIVCTISDKELLEKKYDCVKIIRAAKEAQAVKANKNASILLEELDMERTREESRRAAAARRRERKKKKKMEKKEEKRRLLEGDKAAEVDEQNDDKESDKEEDSDKEEEDEEPVEPVRVLPDREEGDSGIDQGSCSSTETKRNLNPVTDKINKNKKKKNSQNGNVAARNSTAVLPPSNNASSVVSGCVLNSEEDRKNKKKDELIISKNKKIDIASLSKPEAKKLNQPDTEKVHNKKSDNKKKEKDCINKDNTKSKEKERENLVPRDDGVAGNVQLPPPKNTKQIDKKLSDTSATISVTMSQNTKQLNNTPSESVTTSSSRKSLIFTARQTVDKEDFSLNSLNAKTKISAPASTKRTEEGWKEVVRKSSTQQSSSNASSSISSAVVNEMTCKKVQVPVNAISRVIGRAGSNINAIRATTGAHIEVEKQGKNQSERSITIKGLTDATKHAHFLITTLIKDPDVDILQMLPRINPNVKPQPLVVNSWDRNTPLTHTASIITSSTVSSSGSNLSKGNTSSSSNKTTQPVYTLINTNKTNVTTSSNKVTTTSTANARTQVVSSKQGFISQSSRNSTQSNASSFSRSDICNSTQKRSHATTGDTLSSATKTTMSYTNAIMSQKNPLPKTQIQHMSGVTAQTFAAKVTTPALSMADKQKINAENSFDVNSYGISRSTTIVSANNVLSGTIGTFNVADVQVSCSSHQTSVSATAAVRSITPIGPPPITKHRSSSPPLVQYTNACSIDMSATSNAIINTTVSLNSIQPTGLVPQLQSKMSNEYSLFNDSYVNQWESKQIYSTGSSDTIPKADASKAPGYNRGNVLSSPVSSKTSSNSTTPPGVPATNGGIIGQQTLNIHGTTVDTLSPRGGEASAAVAVPSIPQHSVVPPESLAVTSNADVTDMSSLKPCANQNASAVQPQLAPLTSGLAIQRPTTQHRSIPTSQIDLTAANFGPIGSVSTRGTSSTEHIQAPSSRYYEQITQQGISQQLNYAGGEHLPQQYHHNIGGHVIPPNHSGNTISRLNPRATVFSHQNKPNHLSGLFSQNNGNMGVANFQKLGPIGSQHHSMQYNPTTGRPQSQPQTGANARWFPNNEYAYRDMLNLDNSFGMIGSAGGSPKAMSPNNPNMQQQGNAILCQQQSTQLPLPSHTDDIRKMPRPIGTERASWKYNNYPNMNAANNLAVIDSETVAGVMGNPIPQWMSDKGQPQAALNHHQQNWVKPHHQHQRYYGGADYQDQFQLQMDYHSPHPSTVNAGAPINMMQFQYPHFVGAPDIAQIPDKVDWEHHDKQQHAWPNSWSN